MYLFSQRLHIQLQLRINHSGLDLQRMLFNHIGDGALPRSDSNLPGPDKGEWKFCTILTLVVNENIMHVVLSI